MTYNFPEPVANGIGTTVRPKTKPLSELGLGCSVCLKGQSKSTPAVVIHKGESLCEKHLKEIR